MVNLVLSNPRYFGHSRQKYFMLLGLNFVSFFYINVNNKWMDVGDVSSCEIPKSVYFGPLVHSQEHRTVLTTY